MVDATKAITAVTLEYAKAHMRVEHDLEDDVIAALLLSATQAAEARLHRPIIARADATDAICSDLSDVPAAVQTWIVMAAAALFESRELSQPEDLKRFRFADSLLDPWVLYE